MAKNLLVIGIGKHPSMPPKFGARKPPDTSAFGGESPAERDAAGYESEPDTEIPPTLGGMHESTESPEPGDHDLKPGAQFSGSVAHYHGADERCDACNAWQDGECAIWTNVSDPGGWCSVFPADYMQYEKAEAASEGETGGAMGDAMPEAA